MSTSTLIRVALLALVAMVYGQTTRHELVALDDPAYVRDNEMVKRGLTTDGVVWAFTTTTDTNWFPMTWLSLMLDTQIHRWLGPLMPMLFEKDIDGLFPGAYHLTNVVLHAANVLLLFAVLRQMTGAMWRSALVAALLAVHPIHVESVAWVTERKDVLSMFFMLLTIRAYVLYVRDRDITAYLKVALWFALGLMSKTMLVTLPPVLLLLDYWPLRRLDLPPSVAAFWHRACSLALEKVPMVVMAAAVAIVTASVQIKWHTSMDGQEIPLTVRLENVAVSYTRYLGKLFWPVDLAALYPNPALLGQQHWTSLQVVLATFALVVITAYVVWNTRRRWLFVGWFWYLGTIVPVIGFIQIGRHSLADRYAYIPFIGLYVLIAWGLAEVVALRDRARIAVASVAAIALAALTVVSIVQTAKWRDSIAIFTHTLNVTQDNWVIHTGLGMVYLVDSARAGLVDRHSDSRVLLDKGTKELEAALQINPDSGWIIEQLADAYTRAGRHDEVLALWQRAVSINPDYAPWRWTLALAYARQGNHGEALTHARAAVDIDPESADAHFFLAMVLSEQNKLDEAILAMERAFAMNPDLKNVHGAILQRIKQARDASRSPTSNSH